MTAELPSPPARAPAAGPAAGSLLPARRTRLIGRDAIVAAIRQHVLQADGRLVTVTGPGGVGKTSVALEVARATEAAVADGAAFVALDIVRDPGAVVLACADALDLIDTAKRGPARLLADHLAPRQMILVLDNCEHVASGVASLIDRLLDRCPDLRVLATSRVPLRVRGEVVVALPPLELPTNLFDVDALRGSAAVELFVERALAARPEFALVEATAPTVASICRRLGGLPLAIELAAAQVAALTPDEIDARLANRMSLEAAPGPRPERQQTMDATLDWSHDLLDEAEQALFRRLAVFSDGWTLEAAEAVCRIDDPASPVAQTLVRLVDHSLVRREPDARRTQRFRMLEPVAEYASRRLDSSGEAPAVAMAHASYFLAFVGGTSPQWRANERDILARIDAEYENCIVAIRFAEAAGQVPLVLAFDAALLGYWASRGLLNFGLARFQAALALAGEEPSRGRGLALGGLAYFHQMLGDPAAAAPIVREASAVFESVGDMAGLVTTMGIQGDIAADLGDHEGALACYARVRPFLDPEAAPVLFGLWHGNVGEFERARGDAAAARTHLEVAREFLEREPNLFLGKTLTSLGHVEQEAGNLAAATSLMVRALDHALGCGNRLQAIMSLHALASVTVAAGDLARGATIHAAAASSRDATGWHLPATLRTRVTKDLDRLRAALAQAEYDDAWSYGLGLSLDEAAEVARVESSRPMAPRARGRDGGLTPREREIATLVAEGLTNRQIGGRLTITPGTVRIHVERILGKLGMTSRVQVATWVVRDRSGAFDQQGADRLN